MKIQTQFKNASLVSVVNGSIVVKDSTGREHTFTNASVVSVNNGTIIIESKWKPKEGELVKYTWGGVTKYGIFKEIIKDQFWTYGCSIDNLSEFPHALDNPKFRPYSKINLFPVTLEEQKEFDDFCKSQGKIWNKETLQWEKYKWHPKLKDYYYYVDLEAENGVGIHTFENDPIDQRNYIHYNCFQTKEQAEKTAEKVKDYSNHCNMNYRFKNSAIVSVNFGTIVLNVSGKTRTFVDAKLVSAVDGKIVLDLPEHATKNGSYLVVQIDARTERVFIANPYRKCCIDFHVSQCDDQIVYNGFWTNGSFLRNATPEEIQELNDQLAAEGKQWNPDTMQIEKWRWMPRENESYFIIVITGSNTDILEYLWDNDNIDKHVYEIGNCFKTREEAEAKLELIKKLLLEV